MEKILTISVAAYNAENDIARCLDSMVKTSVAQQLEIIVVNDGSKDKTLLVAKEYEDKFPGIVKVIDKENGGHGSTINESIKQATGKYFKIVDSDDWVDKEGIEKLVHELEQINVDLVLNPFHIIDATTLKRNDLIFPFSEDVTLGRVFSIDGGCNIAVYMHSITFLTSLVKKMGPIIDENCFYVDTEYTVFPLVYVNSCVCYDFPIYQYLVGTATQSMNKVNLISRRNQHLRVTKRVIEYYEDNKDSINKGIAEIVLYRVQLALLNQYKIYFNMTEKIAKSEIVTFDHWVKERSDDIYVGPKGRLMKIVWFNRKTRFRFFRPIVKMLKMTHMEPTL